MLKYDLMKGGATKQEVLDFIAATDKPIRYTYGLEYKKPTINHVPISKSEAIEQVKDGFAMMDVIEYDDYLHINRFSPNDLW